MGAAGGTRQCLKRTVSRSSAPLVAMSMRTAIHAATLALLAWVLLVTPCTAVQLWQTASRTHWLSCQPRVTLAVLPPLATLTEVDCASSALRLYQQSGAPPSYVFTDDSTLCVATACTEIELAFTSTNTSIFARQSLVDAVLPDTWADPRAMRFRVLRRHAMLCTRDGFCSASGSAVVDLATGACLCECDPGFAGPTCQQTEAYGRTYSVDITYRVVPPFSAISTNGVDVDPTAVQKLRQAVTVLALSPSADISVAVGPIVPMSNETAGALITVVVTYDDPAEVSWALNPDTASVLAGRASAAVPGLVQQQIRTTISLPREHRSSLAQWNTSVASVGRTLTFFDNEVPAGVGELTFDSARLSRVNLQVPSSGAQNTSARVDFAQWNVSVSMICGSEALLPRASFNACATGVRCVGAPPSVVPQAEASNSVADFAQTLSPPLDPQCETETHLTTEFAVTASPPSEPLPQVISTRSSAAVAGYTAFNTFAALVLLGFVLAIAKVAFRVWRGAELSPVSRGHLVLMLVASGTVLVLLIIGITAAGQIEAQSSHVVIAFRYTEATCNRSSAHGFPASIVASTPSLSCQRARTAGAPLAGSSNSGSTAAGATPHVYVGWSCTPSGSVVLRSGDTQAACEAAAAEAVQTETCISSASVAGPWDATGGVMFGCVQSDRADALLRSVEDAAGVARASRNLSETLPVVPTRITTDGVAFGAAHTVGGFLGGVPLEVKRLELGSSATVAGPALGAATADDLLQLAKVSNDLGVPLELVTVAVAGEAPSPTADGVPVNIGFGHGRAASSMASMRFPGAVGTHFDLGSVGSELTITLWARLRAGAEGTLFAVVDDWIWTETMESPVADLAAAALLDGDTDRPFFPTGTYGVYFTLVAAGRSRELVAAFAEAGEVPTVRTWGPLDGETLPKVFDGVWHHIAIVMTTKGGTRKLRLFVDGATRHLAREFHQCLDDTTIPQMQRLRHSSPVRVANSPRGQAVLSEGSVRIGPVRDGAIFGVEIHKIALSDHDIFGLLTPGLKAANSDVSNTRALGGVLLGLFFAFAMLHVWQLSTELAERRREAEASRAAAAAAAQVVGMPTSPAAEQPDDLVSQASVGSALIVTHDAEPQASPRVERSDVASTRDDITRDPCAVPLPPLAAAAEDPPTSSADSTDKSADGLAALISLKSFPGVVPDHTNEATGEDANAGDSAQRDASGSGSSDDDSDDDGRGNEAADDADEAVQQGGEGAQDAQPTEGASLNEIGVIVPIFANVVQSMTLYFSAFDWPKELTEPFERMFAWMSLDLDMLFPDLPVEAAFGTQYSLALTLFALLYVMVKRDNKLFKRGVIAPLREIKSQGKDPFDEDTVHIDITLPNPVRPKRVFPAPPRMFLAKRYEVTGFVSRLAAQQAAYEALCEGAAAIVDCAGDTEDRPAATSDVLALWVLTNHGGKTYVRAALENAEALARVAVPRDDGAGEADRSAHMDDNLGDMSLFDSSVFKFSANDRESIQQLIGATSTAIDVVGGGKQDGSNDVSPGASAFTSTMNTLLSNLGHVAVSAETTRDLLFLFLRRTPVADVLPAARTWIDHRIFAVQSTESLDEPTVTVAERFTDFFDKYAGMLTGFAVALRRGLEAAFRRLRVIAAISVRQMLEDVLELGPLIDTIADHALSFIDESVDRFFAPVTVLEPLLVGAGTETLLDPSRWSSDVTFCPQAFELMNALGYLRLDAVGPSTTHDHQQTTEGDRSSASGTSGTHREHHRAGHSDDGCESADRPAGDDEAPMHVESLSFMHSSVMQSAFTTHPTEFAWNAASFDHASFQHDDGDGGGTAGAPVPTKRRARRRPTLATLATVKPLTELHSKNELLTMVDEGKCIDARGSLLIWRAVAELAPLISAAGADFDVDSGDDAVMLYHLIVDDLRCAQLQNPVETHRRADSTAQSSAGSLLLDLQRLLVVHGLAEAAKHDGVADKADRGEPAWLTRLNALESEALQGGALPGTNADDGGTSPVRGRIFTRAQLADSSAAVLERFWAAEEAEEDAFKSRDDLFSFGYVDTRLRKHVDADRKVPHGMLRGVAMAEAYEEALQEFEREFTDSLESTIDTLRRVSEVAGAEVVRGRFEAYPKGDEASAEGIANAIAAAAVAGAGTGAVGATPETKPREVSLLSSTSHNNNDSTSSSFSHSLMNQSAADSSLNTSGIGITAQLRRRKRRAAADIKPFVDLVFRVEDDESAAVLRVTEASSSDNAIAAAENPSDTYAQSDVTSQPAWEAASVETAVPVRCPIHKLRLMDASEDHRRCRRTHRGEAWVYQCALNPRYGSSARLHAEMCRSEADVSLGCDAVDFFVCPARTCNIAICNTCMRFRTAPERWAARGVALRYWASRWGALTIFGVVVLIVVQSLYLPTLRNAVVTLFCHTSLSCVYPSCYSPPTSAFLTMSLFSAIILIFVGFGLVLLLLTVNTWRKYALIRSGIFEPEDLAFPGQGQGLGSVTVPASAAVAVDGAAGDDQQMEASAHRSPTSVRGEDGGNGFQESDELRYPTTLWEVIATQIPEGHWEQILSYDRTMLKAAYQAYEFKYVSIHGALFVFKALLVIAVLYIGEPNSLTQLIAVGAVEVAQLVTLTWTNPYTDPWIDTLSKSGAMHQVGQLGLIALYRADITEDPGRRGVVWGMVALAALYLVLVIAVIVFLIIVPIVRGWRAASRRRERDIEEAKRKLDNRRAMEESASPLLGVSHMQTSSGAPTPAAMGQSPAAAVQVAKESPAAPTRSPGSITTAARALPVPLRPVLLNEPDG